MVRISKRRSHKTFKEILFDIIIIFLLLFAGFITFYPFFYVFSMSVSSPEAVLTQSVSFFPKGFTFKSYRLVFENIRMWKSYYNTIWYTSVGTAISVFVTITFAYPLSRKEFRARGFFMIVLAVTMFFSGGIIPSFLVVKNLGLYNTRWAIVLPAAMAAWHVIIARVYFQSAIPDSLVEVAKIDGATDIGILLKIVLPLSLPIISVLSLFYAVGFWNSYFSAMIYLPNIELQPLQIFLRNILITGSEEAANLDEMVNDIEILAFATQIKYSAIIISILPIICVYPFLQKYFIKGVMIGAIKE